MRDLGWNIIAGIGNFFLFGFPYVLNFAGMILLFWNFPIAVSIFYFAMLVFVLKIEYPYIKKEKMYKCSIQPCPENVYVRILWKTFCVWQILIVSYTFTAFKHNITWKHYRWAVKTYYFSNGKLW